MKPNILLLVIDSLRADHLGCYGEKRPLSPVIDALAREGQLWEHCYCPAIPTHPSFTTLYTGRHPIAHNIVSHGGEAALARELPVLPELLLQAGYTTGAVDNLGWGKWAWFNRGYEWYADPSRREAMPLMVSAGALNEAAARFLKGVGQEPFFLLVHYWDVHTPYMPPEPYRGMFYGGKDPCDPQNGSLEKLWAHPLGRIWKESWLKWLGGVTDAAYVDGLYAGALRYLDDELGALLQGLRERGLEENTLVVLVADHGESLTEHGIYYDHHGLYDCCLHVPLLMRWPARLERGVRRGEGVQHFDLTATLLEAAGVEVPQGVEGRALWAEEERSERVVSCECTWQAKWSLRTGEYKYIRARQPDRYGTPVEELYDLRRDPGETRNLSAEQEGVCAVLREELETWLAERLGERQDPLLVQGITLGKRH